MDSLIFTEDSDYGNVNFSNAKEYVKKNCLFDANEEPKENWREAVYKFVDQRLGAVHGCLEKLFYNKFYDTKQQFFDALKGAFPKDYKGVYQDLINGCLITYSKKGGVKLNSNVEKIFNAVVTCTLDWRYETDETECGGEINFPFKWLEKVKLMINFYRLTLKFAKSEMLKFDLNLSNEGEVHDYATFCSMNLDSLRDDSKKPGETFLIANYWIDFPKSDPNEVVSKLEGTHFRFREISYKLYYDNYYCNSDFFLKETDGEDVSLINLRNSNSVISEMKRNYKYTIFEKFLEEDSRYVKDLFYLCFDSTKSSKLFNFMISSKDTFINMSYDIIETSMMILKEREDLELGYKDFYSLGDLETVIVLLQSVRFSNERAHGLLKGESLMETVFDPVSCIEVFNLLKYNKLSWFNSNVCLFNLYYLMSSMPANFVLKVLRSFVCTMWERKRNIVHFTKFVTREIIMELNFIAMTAVGVPNDEKSTKTVCPTSVAISAILFNGIMQLPPIEMLDKLVFMQVKRHISNIENFSFSKTQIEDAIEMEYKLLSASVGGVKEMLIKIKEEKDKHLGVDADKILKEVNNQVTSFVVQDGEGDIHDHLNWAKMAKENAYAKYISSLSKVTNSKSVISQDVSEAFRSLSLDKENFERSERLVSDIERLINKGSKRSYIVKSSYLISEVATDSNKTNDNTQNK